MGHGLDAHPVPAAVGWVVVRCRFGGGAVVSPAAPVLRSPSAA